jgi:hypothetical protein
MERHVIHVSLANEILDQWCHALEKVTTETSPLDPGMNDNFSHGDQQIFPHV